MHVNAGKTKNGVDIPHVDLWNIAMFVPCSGDGWTDSIKAYRAYDVAKYLIDFMTDGTVGFRSTVLDINGEFEGVFLTKGLLLRDVVNLDISLKFTWESFLRNIQNLCNLSFKIDSTGAIPVFVLEKTVDLFEDSVLFTLDNVYSILRKNDTARNYAFVELGSDDNIESLGCEDTIDGSLAYPDQINLVGPKKEQYAVTGTCNLDTSLDLTIDWVISSNVIENILLYADTGYDDNIILLDCENLNDAFPNSAGAILGDVFGVTPPVFYNVRFYNDKVAQRHFGAIPSSLVKYLYGPDTGLRARNTGTEVLTIPGVAISPVNILREKVAFGDDFTPPYFDTNNDFGNGTTPGNLIDQIDSCFTAPVTDMHKFRITYDQPFMNTIFTGTNVIWRFQRYQNDGVTLIATHEKSRILPTITPHYNVKEDSPYIFLNAGDKVYFDLEYFGQASPRNFRLELIATGLQGGTFEAFNPEEYIADLIEFKCPLSMSQFYEMRLNPTKKITVSDGENTFTGWIHLVKHERQNGMASITLNTATG